MGRFLSDNTSLTLNKPDLTVYGMVCSLSTTASTVSASWTAPKSCELEVHYSGILGSVVYLTFNGNSIGGVLSSYQGTSYGWGTATSGSQRAFVAAGQTIQIGASHGSISVYAREIFF